MVGERSPVVEAVVAERPLVGVNNQKTTQMAAPAGSGAVEAYKNTKSPGGKPSVSAAEFVPRASAEVAGKSSALYEKAARDLAGATSGDPFKKSPSKELPPGTYGGRKRRKTKRRGGAMSKTLRELVVDLERDPSESTLRNVLTDLKESPRAMLRANAEDQERALDAPIREEDEPRPRRVRRIIGIMLPMMRAFQYAGRRRKTTRRR
jgi:hypothetical protein